MPVIAINVSEEVADYYNSLRKGTKSKHFSNVLSRHVRLSSNTDYDGRSYQELETIIQQREDGINSLQVIITNLSNQVAHFEKLSKRRWYNFFWKKSHDSK